MSIGAAAVALVATIHAAKVGDVAAGIVRMARTPEQDEATESPFFEWVATTTRSRLLGNVAFRGPVLVLIQSLFILLLPDVPSMLLLIAAVLNVLVALAMILFLLAAAVIHRRRKVNVLYLSGVRWSRVGARSRVPGNVAHPITVIPVVTGSIVVAYAALYHAMYLASSATFATAAGGLGVISSLYFSTITIATVGYGDIYPLTSLAQIAVATQVVMAVTALSLFVSSLASYYGGIGGPGQPE